MGALIQVMQTIIEQATHVVASVSDPSHNARVSRYHLVPHFCYSCGSICVGPPLADHGISYTEMMSISNDIDVIGREV